MHLLFTRRRRVRVHFLPALSKASVEGVLVGRLPDCYLLQAASLLESKDASHDVGPVEIPRSNVLLLQRL